MNARYLILTVITVLTLAVGLSACFNPREGYAPEQPIAFSHKLHAGVNEIPCGFCHGETGDGPMASVPSVNTCMNCHSQVARQSPEVQKIRQAWESGQPIRWVKVHDMPEHVLFSHQPHIARGIDCTECHGQVNRMDVIETTNAFNMGWCVDCHRQPQHNAPIDCVTCHY